METLQDFLFEFERLVAEQGIKKGIFTGYRKISVSPGKLRNTPFGKRVGYIINTPFPMVVDYYGHCKKSKGFFDLLATQRQKVNNNIYSVKIPVVHFEAVKDKHINQLVQSDPLFLGRFFMHKQEIIKLRWGNNVKK